MEYDLKFDLALLCFHCFSHYYTKVINRNWFAWLLHMSCTCSAAFVHPRHLQRSVGFVFPLLDAVSQKGIIIQHDRVSEDLPVGISHSTVILQPSYWNELVHTDQYHDRTTTEWIGTIFTFTNKTKTDKGSYIELVKSTQQWGNNGGLSQTATKTTG